MILFPILNRFVCYAMLGGFEFYSIFRELLERIDGKKKEKAKVEAETSGGRMLTSWLYRNQ